MTPIEIILSAILIILLPHAAYKIGTGIYKKKENNEKRKKEVLSNIKNALDDGINSLNTEAMTPVQIKKLKIKKDKFLIKAEQLIKEISEISNEKITKKLLSDKLLGEQVEIQVIDNLNKTKYYSDYTFAHSIVKHVVENSKFPKKEDYDELNNLYKKYKKLNREKRSEK